MCRELRSFRQSIAAFAKGFDARTLSAAQAGQVVRLCAQIEASAGSIKALAAARAEECKTWERDGFASAAEQLADQTGVSAGAAKRVLETGRRMADQPEVAAAALAGELSFEQATAVSDGAAANPAKAGELIDKAKKGSMSELNDEVAKVKAAAVDQERRRRERHKRRSFRRWTDRDGALQAHIYGHPEDGASVWRMLDPVRRRLNMLRREVGSERDSFEALDYDAMMAIASIAAGRDGELSLSDLLDLGLFPQLDARLLAGRRVAAPTASPADSPADAPSGDGSLFGPSDGSTGPPDTSDTPDTAKPPASPGRKKKLAGRPTKVNIRVDLAALLRGVALEGEMCEIAGYGPVPVSVVERLLETENPFIVGIITKGQTVVGVYHHGRRPNAHQQSALDFLYPRCAALGCNRSTLDYEHRENFADTHITMFDLLDRLCPHHHGLKTRKGWGLVEGTGKRDFVPPDDPRHPGHAGPARRARGRDPTDGFPAAG